MIFPNGGLPPRHPLSFMRPRSKVYLLAVLGLLCALALKRPGFHHRCLLPVTLSHAHFVSFSANPTPSSVYGVEQLWDAFLPLFLAGLCFISTR